MISVIIPAYNSRVFLRETLESVLVQTYTPVEIILINDGSTDGTEKLFPEFEQYGIICRSQSNRGASAARNYGLSIAQGDYIQFLDADDIIHPNKLELQVAEMENKKADLSFTFWGAFNNNVDKVEPYKFLHISLANLKDGKDLMRSFGENNWYLLIHTWLVRRDLIKKAGYWNTHISNNDDGEYFSRILFWARRIVVIETQLAFYRKSDKITLSSINSEQKAYSALYSWELIHALMQSANDKSLLAYPKRGFFVNFLMTRKKFPTISRQFATRFDAINANTFLNKWRFFYFINHLGLFRGYALITVIRKLIRNFRIKQ